MQIVGDPIFSRNESGKLRSRIGTVFLRTPGLVTTTGIHATQRLDWIKHLKQHHKKLGHPQPDEWEMDEEMRLSVDLLFDDQHVLIRPDPYAMDLAFEADELLQQIVSKRCIRFLNTHDARVRNALSIRGENWRMSRLPRSVEEINQHITASRVGIEGLPIYYYNTSTGTRFLTVETLEWLMSLPDGELRQHLEEIVRYSNMRNRFGHPEIDTFPPGGKFRRQAFEALNAEGLPMVALRKACSTLLKSFQESLPANLLPERTTNIEWRNAMYAALTSQPHTVGSDEIIPGISPEFFMQIEWLPGAHIDNGEIIFDPLFAELHKSQGNFELQSLCDTRAKSIILNYVKSRGSIEFINIGRIERSLSYRTPDHHKRENVYVVQVKDAMKTEPDFHVLRFQKWCIYEHLDEGKPMIQAIMEAVDYTDYILDRRLACRQLGMNLPVRCNAERVRETYEGTNRTHYGTRIWVIYFERDYIRGIATDKIHPRRYAVAEFNRILAKLLGEAAAINIIVGRTHQNKQPMFDDGDEVLVLDSNGVPQDLIVSDHTGTFNEYEAPLSINAAAYAAPVNSRTRYMPNPVEFAEIYLQNMVARFEETRRKYISRKRAFDTLFQHQPLDSNGNFAWRWHAVLKRLQETDLPHLAKTIRTEIDILK